MQPSLATVEWSLESRNVQIMENHAIRNLAQARVEPVPEKIMKRNSQDPAIAVANGAADEGQKGKRNGNSGLRAEPASGDLSAILASLQTMRRWRFFRATSGFLDRTGGKNCRYFQFHCCCQPTNGRRTEACWASGRARKEEPVSARAFMNPEGPGARWKSRSIRWLRICFGPPRA